MTDGNSKNIYEYFNFFALVCILLGTSIFDLTSRSFRPNSYYCDRPWQCIGTGEFPPFIPHSSWHGSSRGNLASFTGLPKYSVQRDVKFTVDAYGFRNQVAVERDIDIVVVGDSFGVGANLSDAESICSFFESKLGRSCYNYSGATLEQFYYDQRFVKQTPKLVLGYFSEANLSDQNLKIRQGRRFIERPYFDSIDHYRQSTLFARLRQNLKHRHRVLRENSALTREIRPMLGQALDRLGLYQLPDTVVLGTDGETLFYKKSVLLSHKPRLGAVANLAAAVKSTTDALASRGVHFILVPIPEKEAVYRKLLKGLEEDPYQFTNKLLNSLPNSHFCNVHQALERAQSGPRAEQLYFRDDTHLTPYGANIVYQRLRECLLSLEDQA